MIIDILSERFSQDKKIKKEIGIVYFNIYQRLLESINLDVVNLYFVKEHDADQAKVWLEKEGFAVEKTIRSSGNVLSYNLIVSGWQVENKIIKISEVDIPKLMNSNSGVCLGCEEIIIGGIEPDARKYECEICGENKVYGIEECILNNYIIITKASVKDFVVKTNIQFGLTTKEHDEIIKRFNDK